MRDSAKHIDNSDAFPAAGLQLVSEAELDGVAGGRIKQEGPGRTPAQGGGAGGQSLESQPWNSHPPYTYLP